jgi:hypothetical protein
MITKLNLAEFIVFKKIVADGWTDGPTDGQTTSYLMFTGSAARYFSSTNKFSPVETKRH